MNAKQPTGTIEVTTKQGHRIVLNKSDLSDYLIKLAHTNPEAFLELITAALVEE
jgi:hypothetical protein